MFLFKNLISLSAILRANRRLRGRVTPSFRLAVLPIVTGLALGQTDREKIVGARRRSFD